MEEARVSPSAILCLALISSPDGVLSCDSIPSMKSTLTRLRDKLGSDPAYFQQVYNHTFDFARGDGQRSLGPNLALLTVPLVLMVDPYLKLSTWLRISGGCCFLTGWKVVH